MDLLLILTYTAICVVIFKVFKIPLNKWTVPTAVLGGIVLIGALIFLMNYNHPYSEISREYFVTTPIVPAVSGNVVSVSVAPMMKVKQGDVLFNIDPEPFQNKVDSLTAQIALAQDDAERARTLLKSRNISQRDADATLTRLASLEGALETAQFELEQTTVRAPTNGYVPQMTLRPGMRAASLPLRPVMIFVHEESLYFIGWFRQNSLLRLTVGDDAEVAFDGIPGRVFSGKVKYVLLAISEGQLQPSGDLISPLKAPHPGRIPVWIEITDPEFEEFRARVPGGAYAQAAIYSEHLHHVAIMRKILLRMSAWMNYLFPFH
ncbi:MAG: efflux RND transporter periplasmic adaptor subunit [Xanthomonadales bacterium]|nr:efflux RND transporter periplasmic adaptor subunit [Xanthomonadales bacterium]